MYGVARAVVSVVIGHTIIHFAIFKDPQMNLFFVKFGQWFTVSTQDIWTITHNISHHTFVFTPDDIQTNYGWKRTQPWIKQKNPGLQRYQHYYIWILYCFGAFVWISQDLFESISELFITRRNRIGLPSPIITRITNVVVCVFSLFTSTFLPYFYHDAGWATLLAVTSTIITSVLVVFQIVVNHEEEVVMEPLRTTEYPDKIDWGLHQLNTSVNFAPTSNFWIQIGGGLNLQVEHHLFPSIHYFHYPAIREIVKQVVKEQGLKYHEFDTMWDAIVNHYKGVKLGASADKDFMAMYFSKSR
jgi:linoleoyl-CoA desaturase